MKILRGNWRGIHRYNFGGGGKMLIKKITIKEF
jgi:hypothetical protein